MTALDLDHLVQPDRVHRSVYTDQALFDLEMEHMFEKTWVYWGHESQVKAVGDHHTLHMFSVRCLHERLNQNMSNTVHPQ